MITHLTVSLPKPPATAYPIWIGADLLENCSKWMPTNVSTVVIITDHHVKKLYAKRLDHHLKKAGYNTLLLSFPAGEKSKTARTKSKIEEKMLTAGCDRHSLILAMGGGVVGDLAGFIAATYMRGISYIQLPTTFLAMIDSAVGGKTGIDTPQGKNLIGAFWQPIAVIADTQCLKTLPKQHMINGLIEAIKIFLLCDVKSLTDVQENLDLILSQDVSILNNIIHRAVTLKATIVINDEKDKGQRAILNFGHTIGHALEHLTDYKHLHGYAVALGLLVEAKIAQLLNVLAEEHYVFIKRLLNRLNIESSALKQFDVHEIIQCTQTDKKKQDGVIPYVLINALGSVYTANNRFAHPVPESIVQQAFLDTIED
jgi:3-dehydroquinate synthase